MGAVPFVYVTEQVQAGTEVRQAICQVATARKTVRARFVEYVQWGSVCEPVGHCYRVAR